jgi:hypothetical protein
VPALKVASPVRKTEVLDDVTFTRFLGNAILNLLVAVVKASAYHSSEPSVTIAGGFVSPISASCGDVTTIVAEVVRKFKFPMQSQSPALRDTDRILVAVAVVIETALPDTTRV